MIQTKLRAVGSAVGVLGSGLLFVLVPASASAAPPANDDFADAEVISGTGPLAVDGTNVEATKEAGEPNHAGNVGGHSVWYEWTAPGDGDVTVATCTSLFDTLLAAYTGNDVSGLTEVASNDDAPFPCGGGRSTITFPVTSGSSYRIAVDGKNAAAGALTVSLSFAPPAPPDGGDGGPTDLGEASCSKSGRYRGTTSQGEKVCFRLAGKGKKILDFQLRFISHCSSPAVLGGASYTVYTKPIRVRMKSRSAKTGTFQVKGSDSILKGTVRGSRAHGSMTVHQTVLGTTSVFCDASFKWSARRGYIDQRLDPVHRSPAVWAGLAHALKLA